MQGPYVNYRTRKGLLRKQRNRGVKITLTPSAWSADGVSPHQYATSYVINDTVAIDAGAIGFWRGPAEQARIRHVFLSHTHIDHLASLPIFLENIIGESRTPVTLYASIEVERCLRMDVFNGRLWANFLELTQDGQPFALVRNVASGQTVEVDGLRITAVAVNHVVPTLGFIVEDSAAAVVISSDTGPTEEIWARARALPNLKAVFLETAFPNAHQELADLTLHLTPAGFVGEMKKLPGTTRFYAVHLKARFRDQIVRELLDAGPANLELARFGEAYEL
jgi:ribonuclease BN (tRNA processing enzyme)